MSMITGKAAPACCPPRLQTQLVMRALPTQGTRVCTTDRLLRSRPKGPPGRERRAAGVAVKAIGFDLPGGDDARGTEKKVDDMLRSAASLLCFSSVLRGKPAQAFLMVLRRLQGGRLSDVLMAYGELHESLHARGYSGWQDYVLRQLFWGKQCTFAASAAAGRLDPGLDSPIHQAARHDLDVLQELCSIDVSTLVKWIQIAYPLTDPAWQEAAVGIRSFSDALPEERVPDEQNGSANGAPKPDFCGAPATPLDLSNAIDSFLSNERWSDGLAELQAYYEAHGSGLLGHHWAVGWQDDGLVELETAETLAASRTSWPMQGVPARRAPSASSLEEAQSDALRCNTFAHLQGPGAQHCLLCGPPGGGTSVLLWELLSEAAQKGLRVVQLPATGRQLSQKSLGSLCRALGRYRRTRFVVVAENLQVRAGTEEHTALITMLTGMGGGLWPENVLLYATASPEGPVPGSSDNGAIEGCFGIAVTAGKQPDSSSAPSSISSS